MAHNISSTSRILIVDDEPANVRLLERILELSGGPVVESTTDPRQATALLSQFQPDVVLLDLNMPHLSGYDVMAQIQDAIGQDCYLPVLVLTADITPQTRRKALAAGARDFVTKPLDSTEVVLRIKNLLETRSLHLDMQQRVRERTGQLENALAELHAAQEHVVKQERLRALGMMAGGVAHDFNNALTMILGYGELLLPWLQQHATPRELSHLNHILAAAQDATHVVSRLREFYRPAENNEIRVPIDLSEVARAAVSLTAPRWKGKSRAEGVQIDVRLDLAEVPLIAGNGAELREVLTNLIFNAVDAMPDGGSIVVRTGFDEERVVVSVADTGIGMTEAERARCLEPFFTTKGEAGTGLGLAVTYGIVQRHEGVIEITSEVGVGTEFSISIPIRTAAAEVTIAHPPQVDRALRILVVDDQEMIGELIAEYLRCDGHQASTAVDGAEALAVFMQEQFDLVITDQSMPGMSGAQLATTIKARSPLTPVILLSGFGEELMGADQPPAVDVVLGKPASAQDLRTAVVRALEAGAHSEAA